MLGNPLSIAELRRSLTLPLGNPASYESYALAITPLISRLNELQEDVSQVWFVDDATAAASCHNLRSWWDQLSIIGPQYSHHPIASKTFLVVINEYEDEAKTIFGDTTISVTTRSKRHLRAAVRSRTSPSNMSVAKLKSGVTAVQ